MKLTILALILSVFFLLSFIPNVSAVDWWNTALPFRWEINESNATTGQPFSVNGTSGVGTEEAIIWTLPRTEKVYLYCNTENCDNIRAIANETDELVWENETTRTGNGTIEVWSNKTSMVLHFGERTGTVAWGSTQYGHTCNLTGTYQHLDNGTFGYDIDFDGIDGRCSVADHNSLDLTTEGTVEAWVKPEGTTTFRLIAGKLQGTGGAPASDINYMLMLDDAEHARICTSDGVNNDCIVGSDDIVDGNKHHLIFTWSAATKYIYVDGALDNSGALAKTPQSTNFPVYVGFYQANFYFNGEIDEVRIYNRTLTAAEVQEKYWDGINNLTHLELGESILTPDFPGNGDTFCNRFIIDNVYVNVGNASSCSFILNDADNATGDCNLTIFNSTINGNTGENNLTVFWWNYTGINSKTILFNMSICCSSAYENDTICAGLDFSNIARCKKFGAFTFQFDYGNMTPCVSGCMDGSCINRTSCLDRCRTGEVTCNKNYRTLCGQKPDGCLDWTTDDQEYCSFGCMNGVCMNCTSECNYGGSKCFGSQLRWCDDDNKDGCFEYSLKNSSDCEFGCNEELNMTTGLVNISCNYHSFDDTYILRQGFLAAAKGIDYIFPTLLLRTYLSLLVALVGGFLITVKTGSGWRGGLGVMAIVIFIASWLGWFMWPGAIIFFIFTAFMFTRGDRIG